MKQTPFVMGFLLGLAVVFTLSFDKEQKPVIQTVTKIETITQTEYVPVNHSQPVEMIITEYTSGYESTQKHPGQPGYGITSSGTKAHVGTCAADTAILSYGTTVYIQGIGKCVVEDTGAAVRGNHIDVWVNSVKDALKFGRQTRKVWILNDF